jgi:hypothetical protein
LAKLLRANKAIGDGIQLSEAITGDGAAIFRHACGPRRHSLEAHRFAIRERQNAGMAETKNANFKRG